MAEIIFEQIKNPKLTIKPGVFYLLVNDRKLLKPTMLLL